MISARSAALPVAFPYRQTYCGNARAPTTAMESTEDLIMAAVSVPGDSTPQDAGAAAHKQGAPRRAVFLHTGWRTAGTWLWSRFREMPGVEAYYEPLHEGLERISLARIHSLSWHQWASGHPVLARPYFHEFAPLLRPERGGVERYRAEFAIKDFFADASTPLPDLQAYVASLLGFADRRCRQPVLKFCRSIGRVGWMQHNFPGAVHVVVVRNPAAQFASALHQHQRHANPYFLVMPLLVLSHNWNNPRVMQAVNHFGVRLPLMSVDRSRGVAEPAWREHLRRTGPEDWYRGFLAFWVLAMLSIPATVDCVLDSELLTLSDHYREVSQRDLATLTGIPIDFGHDPHSIDIPAGIGITRTVAHGCHQAVETFLIACKGPGWRDTALGARIGAMLACADLAAMDGGATLIMRSVHEMSTRDKLRERAAAVERELSAVYDSVSWRITTPLRRTNARLGALLCKRTALLGSMTTFSAALAAWWSDLPF
jgi:hypothetical protein